MQNMLIDGICVPLTTPFYRDGTSYLKKLEHNVGRYSLTPAASLMALPPGGEGLGLTDAEVAETLATVATAAAAEKVLIAGIERGSVRAALWVAEQAAEAEFDAVLVAAPLGWQSMAAGERELFYRAVADGAPLPVMVVDEAGLALGDLAAHPNVIGVFAEGLTAERYAAIAEATRGVKREVTVTTVFAPVTRRMKAPAVATGGATFVSAESLGGGVAVAVAPPVPALKTRTKTVGFQVMAVGAAAGLPELLAAGVAGAMPRLAACAPQAVHEVYAAFKDGDPALAAVKAERLVAADALMAELGVAGVKYACDLNGYFGGIPRLPRLALDGAQRERVERVMAGLRN